MYSKIIWNKAAVD